MRVEGLHVALGYPLIPFLSGIEGHHMVLPCPDICTAHTGESESLLPSSPSLCVLKQSLLSFSLAVEEVYVALKNYGSFIRNSVLHAKRAYCIIVGIYIDIYFFSPMYPNKRLK